MVEQDNTQKVMSDSNASKNSGRKPMFTELWSIESGFKEEFLEFLKNDTMLSPNTINNYEITLRKISDYEINQMDKQKDLFEFTDPEIETMIRYFGFSKFKSVQSCISLINKYLIYANEKGVMKNRINFIYEKLPGEIHKLLVNRIKQGKQVITRDELYQEIFSSIKNAQDLICFILPFEGLSFKEMINLKHSDIDMKNNTIRLEHRSILVPQKAIDALDDAISVTNYLSKNGKATGKLSDLELMPSSYVLKPTIIFMQVNKDLAGEMDDVQVNQAIIRRRIDMIKKMIGKPHLSYSALRESGMRDVFLQNKEALKYMKINVNTLGQVLGKFGNFTTSQLNKIKEEYVGIIEKE